MYLTKLRMMPVILDLNLFGNLFKFNQPGFHTGRNYNSLCRVRIIK